MMGCGGGFDVYTGLPLAVQLQERGCSITFANLSFTFLNESGAPQLDEITWQVDANAKDLPYFPERWLCEYLLKQGSSAQVFSFAKSGAIPLAKALRTIVDQHKIDRILLVDGGTDSVLFGDEPGLGTIVEDAVSIVAACMAVGDRADLASIGFGIDHFHGVSHHSYLENVAQLIKEGGFLGSFSVVQKTKAAETFLELVDYANERLPQYPSIVCNSIASAVRGNFGDYHVTDRTSGSELFINPLMAQYWTFAVPKVMKQMKFADALAETKTFAEAAEVIKAQRQQLPLRERRALPL